MCVCVCVCVCVCKVRFLVIMRDSRGSEFQLPTFRNTLFNFIGHVNKKYNSDEVARVLYRPKGRRRDLEGVFGQRNRLWGTTTPSGGLQ